MKAVGKILVVPKATFSSFACSFFFFFYYGSVIELPALRNNFFRFANFFLHRNDTFSLLLLKNNTTTSDDGEVKAKYFSSHFFLVFCSMGINLRNLRWQMVRLQGDRKILFNKSNNIIIIQWWRFDLYFSCSLTFRFISCCDTFDICADRKYKLKECEDEESDQNFNAV